MKKKYITWSDIESMTKQLITQMELSNFRPDIVWGLVRGGCVPAILISQHYDIPMHTWHVSTRDHQTLEPADADWDVDFSTKKCLIVDDINDSGTTINRCQLTTEPFINVKYAVLQHKETSKAKIDYYAEHIDKSKCNEWIVYPWEEWSK